MAQLHLYSVTKLFKKTGTYYSTNVDILMDMRNATFVLQLDIHSTLINVIAEKVLSVNY